MHDDSNIRALFRPDALTLVKNSDAAGGDDAQRRVVSRQETNGLNVIDGDQPDAPESAGTDEDAHVKALPISPETVALRAQLALLRQEHKDLDDSISALESVPQPDQILIARLKRKKLALRDQIVTIEDRIRPDIIA